MSPSSTLAPPPLPPPPSPPPPPPPATRSARDRVGAPGWLLRIALAAAGLAISYQLDGGILFGIVAVFVVIVPFEKLYPRQKGQRLRRPLALTDISFALFSPVLNIVGLVAIVAIGGLSLFWLPGLALRPLVAQIPTAALPFVAFVMFDFLGYWAHRWAHEVPFLWRFHSVHHSPEHMDWVSGFRVHPFDGVLIAPAFFFVLGAGIDGQIAGLLAIIQIVLGIFFHANARFRWRWIDKVAANPEFHHWHHANEADSIGHNYAPALPQWDLLFGTYFMPKHQTGRRPTHYGVDEYMPRNMLGLLTHPCRGARTHVSLLWHPIRAVKAAARGWRTLLRGIVRSATRSTHRARRATAPGCSSTNASLGISVGIVPIGAVPVDTVSIDAVPGAEALVLQ